MRPSLLSTCADTLPVRFWQQLTVTSATRWAESEEYKDKIYFAKFDVDALPDLAQELGIRAMPTFILFQDGDKADDFLGANPAGLKNVLAKYI